MVDEPICQRRNRTCHLPCIDHQHDRHAEYAREVCSGPFAVGRGAIKEAHGAFDDEWNRACAEGLDTGISHRPSIKIEARVFAGCFVKLWVDVVRTRFGGPYVHVTFCQRPQKAKGDGGFAAARRWRGDDKTHRIWRRVDASGGSFLGKMISGCMR